VHVKVYIFSCSLIICVHFFIGEPSKAVSPTNENSSQDICGKEVQALPESKDQNENVVEPPTAYTGNKEVSIVNSMYNVMNNL
jgi:hypothetical protein